MKEKLIMQHDETDCAAACVASIAKYYGKNISIARIRFLAGTDTKGTTGLGIIKVCKKLGFSCKGGLSENKNLSSDFPYPMIIHIKKEVIDHYCVLYKGKGNKFLLADPDSGFKKINLEELQKIWTGVFFLMLPEEKFEKVENSNSVLTRFLFLLKPHKKTLIQCFVAGIVLSILGIISAFYFRFLIDEVLYSELKSMLTLISIGFVIVTVMHALVDLSRNQLMLFMSNKIDVVMIKQYLTHVLSLPMNFFTSRKTGEILSRIGDTNTIRRMISSTSISIIIDICMLFIGGGVLFLFGSKLLIVSIIPVIISSIVAWIFIKPYKQRLKTKAVLEADKQSSIVEMINNISVVKSLSIENAIYDKLEPKIIETANRGIKLGTMGNVQEMLQMLISELGTLAIYWIGSILIFNNQLSLGQLISFVTLSKYFLGPFSRLINLQYSLQEALIASDRLCEILDLDKEYIEENNLLEIEKINQPIEIKNVTFCYGSRGKTLDNVSLKINPGEKVAFVGSSGSGKTTLIKLLMKFYSPQSGSILVNNYNIEDVDTVSYRKQIGYVPQEVMLFSGSVIENISIGGEVIDFSEILEATVKSDSFDFIQRLPQRFNTKIGEHGATLSGGERQRISLARTLVKKPSLLILDEATASLDSISEAEIMKTINCDLGNLTTIIVAHRLSTIVNCDKIFVFDKGKIIEEGSHKELLLRNGAYAKMWNMQNGKFKQCRKKRSENEKVCIEN